MLETPKIRREAMHNTRLRLSPLHPGRERRKVLFSLSEADAPHPPLIVWLNK